MSRRERGDYLCLADSADSAEIFKTHTDRTDLTDLFKSRRYRSSQRHTPIFRWEKAQKDLL